MRYSNNLRDRIQDSEKWPSFERTDFLSVLNEIADEAMLKDTTEGYLASVLIYHQLSEEIIKLLIECSNFLIQVAIFPAEISFKKNEKRMYGQLITELEDSVEFPHKQKLIFECKKLNEIRIKMVHKLTLKSSL